MGTDKWLWVDVETTGLGYSPATPDVNRDDQILELAAIITDTDLNELDAFESYVVHAGEDTLVLMDDYVRDMHARTGLTDKVRASTNILADLEAALGAWLDGHGMDAKVLLGEARLRLHPPQHARRNMPAVFSRLHYRVLDVSSFKETLRRWHPEVVAELESVKVSTHEAMDDIRWSVRELDMYRRALGL